MLTAGFIVVKFMQDVLLVSPFVGVSLIFLGISWIIRLLNRSVQFLVRDRTGPNRSSVQAFVEFDVRSGLRPDRSSVQAFAKFGVWSDPGLDRSDRWIEFEQYFSFFLPRWETARSCVLARSDRALKFEGARPCLLARPDRGNFPGQGRLDRSGPVWALPGPVLDSPLPLISVFGPGRSGPILDRCTGLLLKLP